MYWRKTPRIALTEETTDMWGPGPIHGIQELIHKGIQGKKTCDNIFI